MACCGQRRAALRTPPQATPRRTPTPPVLQRPALLAFTGVGPIIMRGTGTGLTYAFPAGSAALAVDGRDVDRMLATGRFRRA